MGLGAWQYRINRSYNRNNNPLVSEDSHKELGYSAATISGSNLNQAKPVNPVTGLISKVLCLSIQTADNSVNPQVESNAPWAKQIDPGVIITRL